MEVNLLYPFTSHQHPYDGLGDGPVDRMEAGEKLDGLPKYSAQAQVDEQTVARSAPGLPRTGIWLDWMGRPSMPSQLDQTPSRPPPAYNPSASRQA